jgi:archaea-specific DNA-binding protein
LQVEEKTERKHPAHAEKTSEPSSETRTERPQRPMSRAPPDVVFIGKKPLMAYATAVMMHFNSGQKQLTVKARGQSISHAVDVVEVVRNRFFQGKLSIKEVRIGTEMLGEGEDQRNVSTIEIVLAKSD